MIYNDITIIRYGGNMEAIIKQSIFGAGTFSEEEFLRVSRRFSRVSNSLYCEKGYQLYVEKFVSWIGSKTRKKSGKHVNFYAFNRRDFSALNHLLNQIYLKEEKLKEKLKVDKIEEIEALRRNVIFDITRENNEQKMNFSQINRDIKQRITEARLRIGQNFKNEEFNINRCAELWYEEFYKIQTEDKFKDIDEFLLNNYITFNVAFQYVYDCATLNSNFDNDEFLNVIRNINALTFGTDFSRYRNVRAFVRGCNWTPVEEEEISKKMDILVDWYLNDNECKKLHPIEAAAILNCEIIRTQPFPDGNHRTARLVTNEVLIREDIPPIAISLGKRDEYNRATNQAIETHELDAVIDIFEREVYRNAMKIDAKLDILENKNAISREK